jgi:hypothetical protein
LYGPAMEKGDPDRFVIGSLLCVHSNVIGSLRTAGSDVDVALHVTLMESPSVILDG